MAVQVIDNFLDKENFNKIQSCMVSNIFLGFILIMYLMKMIKVNFILHTIFIKT